MQEEQAIAGIERIEKSMITAQDQILKVLATPPDAFRESKVIGSLSGMIRSIGAYLPELQGITQPLVSACHAIYSNVGINGHHCWIHSGDENMGGWTCQHPDCKIDRGENNGAV